MSCVLFFFFQMRKPNKDGHIVLGCPFLSKQKEGGNARSQKSRALRMGARVLFTTSFNRLPKAATSSVLGDAHPHGPSNLQTQFVYSPAALTCLPGALHLPQSPGYWTSGCLTSPHVSGCTSWLRNQPPCSVVVSWSWQVCFQLSTSGSSLQRLIMTGRCKIHFQTMKGTTQVYECIRLSRTGTQYC